jgi:hypothetical protein
VRLYRVDHHGRLSDQKLARSPRHRHALLFGALDGDEAHRQPVDGLADRVRD